jgi:hypothetical protein
VSHQTNNITLENDESEDTESQKPPYQAPQVIPLSDLAVVEGACVNGSFAL